MQEMDSGTAQLRFALSLVFFFTALCLVFLLLSQGYKGSFLLGAGVFYLLAYWTWPKRASRKQRKHALGRVVEGFADLLIEFPIRLLIMAVRSVGHFVSHLLDAV